MTDIIDKRAFQSFRKIPRLSRECLITEKLDGTNAQITISEDGSEFLIGSRNRWITPGADNYGFAKWAMANKEELLKLGPGTHYGEWWGPGIGRGYGVAEKKFSLFNVSRWSNNAIRPACCDVVPLLYQGPFTTNAVEAALAKLGVTGSIASPGFMRPEGVVVYHVQAGVYFKKTLENDGQPKGLVTK